MSTKPPNICKNALRSLLFYSLDMSVAVFGWVYGFGLEVKSWPALVGIMLFSRWVMHLLQHAWYYEEAKARVAQNSPKSETA